ncbi:glutathione S-transferase T3-like [Lolium rigidum]|uniref:glutathione S-transferase T3-like n=1 Tax=Lolium rigidum TaxID=89674 RepID=UPI001F5D6964|nr:glutathione S-transferase T3-like [Lolium rigidum]
MRRRAPWSGRARREGLACCGGCGERGWGAAAGAERWAGGYGGCGLEGSGAHPGGREGGGCGLEVAALALEKGMAAGAAWRVVALAVDSGEAGLAIFCTDVQPDVYKKNSLITNLMLDSNWRASNPINSASCNTINAAFCNNRERNIQQRKKNWSSDEDKVLIAAWANTSMDIVGTDQNRETYWARISEYYNTHKESSWPECNANAINCRYTLINRETAKFFGCLQQIINLEESGRTIQEKTNDAHLLFKDLDIKRKKSFTLMHCYVEFSKYPKWQTRELETSVKKQKKTIDASPGTVTNDPADASSVRTDATSAHTDALEHEKRPDGVKKEKLRRGKVDGSACKLSLETVWAQKQEKDELKEAARNVRYAQQFELREEEIALKKKEDARNERDDARKQFELDERIMLMDTSGMTDVQKQFYQARQNEILARGLE